MSDLGSVPYLPSPSSTTRSDRASSTSPSRKRYRDGSPVESTSFLQTARNLVAQRSDVSRCWNCKAPHTEFCHVIARADPAYPAMMKKGMMTFGPLGNYRNAIVLCGSCHNHFDRTSNTGWVPLPSELQWFIEWEEQDFARRSEIFAQTETVTDRRYPDEQDYEKHLRGTGLLSDPDDGLCRGGLYHSYILEEMFSPYMMEALARDGLTVPFVFPGGARRWHGAPMAAINRGFQVTGAPEMKLPEHEWNLLRRLQVLYSRKLPNASSCNVRVTHDVPAGTGGDDTGTGVVVRRGHLGGAFSRDDGLSGRDQISGGQTRDQCPIDSAIDIASPNGRSLKRRRGSRYSTDGYSNGGSNDSRRRRKQHLREKGFGEERTGSCPEAWCFGPESSTDHKVKAHIGRKLLHV